MARIIDCPTEFTGISNAEFARGCGSGWQAAQVLFRWPAEVLGKYGANECTDADMSLYVLDRLPAQYHAQVTAITAGRTSQLIPVIAVGISLL